MNKQFFIKQIRQNFPSLKFKKLSVINHGWNKTVIVMDHKTVFAFPKNDEARNKFISELKILPKLNKKITLPIPDFKFIPTNKTFVGYPFISGSPLSLSKFKTLSSGQKNTVAKNLSVFLNELHSFSVSTAQKNNVTLAWSEKDAKDYYSKQINVVYKKLTLKDAALLEDIFKTHCGKITKSNFKKTVTHQDLTSDHILFNNKTKRICGIIDFGGIQIGDPAIDFSKLWEYGKEFVSKLIDSYNSKDKQLISRSFRWYIYECVENMYCGITMNRKDYWRKGYALIKSNSQLLVKK